MGIAPSPVRRSNDLTPPESSSSTNSVIEAAFDGEEEETINGKENREIDVAQVIELERSNLLVRFSEEEDVAFGYVDSSS